MYYKNSPRGTSLVIQWLRLCAFTVGCMGSIPGWRTSILHAVRLRQKKKIPELTSSVLMVLNHWFQDLFSLSKKKGTEIRSCLPMDQTHFTHV